MYHSPFHAAEIVPDQIDYHQVLGLLFGRFQQLFGHGARRRGGLLNRAFDGPELDRAASSPREEAFWAAAYYFDAVGVIFAAVPS